MMTNESKLTSLDLILDAIALEYEQASPTEREAMSPFFKMFHDIAKQPQSSNVTAVCNE